MAVRHHLNGSVFHAGSGSPVRAFERVASGCREGHSRYTKWTNRVAGGLLIAAGAEIAALRRD